MRTTALRYYSIMFLLKRYKFRRLWIIHVLNHIRKAQEIEKINAQTRKDGEEQGLDEEEVANNLQKYKV